ncbi:MAG: transcriptional regulator NrdR [Planctomycetota bacterium]|nr:transcriptional regulator NrdR [Planctomycetota bacterium]
MKCPRCSSDDDRVVDSRTSADGVVIRRRRECLECFMRFTTYERIEESPLRVIKKNGERVRFDRDRILHGMLRACEKLPVSMADIEEAVMRVEARCQGEYDREVPSSVIGSLVMDELRQLDQVAYVRFASVYREFKDVGQFMSELETILDEDVEGIEGAGDAPGAPDAGMRPAPGAKTDAGGES